MNVKAKTAEGLGPVGAGDAVESHAVVLMRVIPAMEAKARKGKR